MIKLLATETARTVCVSVCVCVCTHDVRAHSNELARVHAHVNVIFACVCFVREPMREYVAADHAAAADESVSHMRAWVCAMRGKFVATDRECASLRACGGANGRRERREEKQKHDRTHAHAHEIRSFTAGLVQHGTHDETRRSHVQCLSTRAHTRTRNRVCVCVRLRMMMYRPNDFSTNQSRAAGDLNTRPRVCVEKAIVAISSGSAFAGAEC